MKIQWKAKWIIHRKPARREWETLQWLAIQLLSRWMNHSFWRFLTIPGNIGTIKYATEGEEYKWLFIHCCRLSHPKYNAQFKWSAIGEAGHNAETSHWPFICVATNVIFDLGIDAHARNVCIFAFPFIKKKILLFKIKIFLWWKTLEYLST